MREIGEDVNIGAGSITANYDGKQKHKTVIGNGAFIGSDTILRAPVNVGEGAYTGAGSVVTRDVPPGKLAVECPPRIRERLRQLGSQPEPRRARSRGVRGRMEILIIAFLIFLNGLFVAAEFSLVRVRRTRVEQLEEEGTAARDASIDCWQPGRFLATIQIGLTFVGFLAATFAGASIVDNLRDWPCSRSSAAGRSSSRCSRHGHRQPLHDPLR